MPYGGLGSFLLIDYEYSNMNIQLVSMPYFGLLPFLPRIYGNSYTKKNDCFNALLRASFFSTCYHKEVITCYGGCFNALLRASFFSTIKSNMRDFLPENVSMPYFGLLSFLQVMWQLELFHGNVSMPYFGLLSFLRHFRFVTNCKINSFNALLRASFFSTNDKYTKERRSFYCFNALLRASFFSTNIKTVL